MLSRCLVSILYQRLQKCSFFSLSFRNVSNDGIYQYTFAHMNKLLKLPRILKCVGITDAFLKENVEEIAIGGSVKVGYNIFYFFAFETLNINRCFCPFRCPWSSRRVLFMHTM